MNIPPQGWCRLRAALCATALLLSCCVSCKREDYRMRADADAYSLIGQKANHPHWCLQDYNIQPDARSRFYDPYAQDCPPMPTDDPYSHRYMHWVDGKRGYPHWHRSGNTPHVENPIWYDQLPVDEDGTFRLDAPSAVRVALLHSPNYQQQLETLYLSALDVSAERFRFDTMYFFGLGGGYDNFGRRSGGAFGENRLVGTRARSNWSLDSNAGATKLYATGAELAVGIANSLLWQVAGPDTHSANTLINFTFLQPLLRQAGRDVVLETLTIAERTLLANVRQMERYRRGFFLDIYVGTGGQGGPNRRGGFQGGSGITGFAGVGAGGFGGVGANFAGGGGGGGGGGGAAGAGTASGFLGLLQQKQLIRNQETNISSLRSSLAQLEAFREAGRIDFFQVEQVRQQLFQSTSVLLVSKRSYQDSLDRFKADLGLPPQLDLRIEDPLLDQFNLIDQYIAPRQNDITDLQQSLGRQIVEVQRLVRGDDPDNPTPAKWSRQLVDQLKRIREEVARGEKIRRQVTDEDLPRVRSDIDRLARVISDRQENSQRMLNVLSEAKQTQDNQGRNALIRDVDASLFDVSQLEQLPNELTQALKKKRAKLRENAESAQRVLAAIDQLLENGESLSADALETTLRDEIFEPGPGLLTELSADLLEIALVQARARGESVTLPKVDITPELALEIARAFRRDWMNNRAALVDTWRLIEFNADRLEGDLSLVISGDVANVGDNPFRLRSATGRLNMGFQFDAPIQRLVERNVYRQALIDYQQAKRTYYRFRDGVASTLRSILRQVELSKINFELRRTALRVAVAQVESARLRLQEPPRQADAAAQSAALGPTTAQNLITALNSLISAQNDFLAVWVDFEVQRGLLDLNLGTMQLTEDGLWIDPGAIGPEYGYPVLDAEFWNNCYLKPKYLHLIEDAQQNAATGDANGELLPAEDSGAPSGDGSPAAPLPGPPPVIDEPAPLPPAIESEREERLFHTVRAVSRPGSVAAGQHHRTVSATSPPLASQPLAPGEAGDRGGVVGLARDFASPAQQPRTGMPGTVARPQPARPVRPAGATRAAQPRSTGFGQLKLGQRWQRHEAR